MGPVTVFVDPGKYDYVTCDQLINLHKQWAERELELKVLMDKAEQSRAEQSASGVVVNFMAYQLITRWPMKNSR
jgi:hypothetical protein